MGLVTVIGVPDRASYSDGYLIGPVTVMGVGR